MTDAELLQFHRGLVETPSVSRHEGPIADLVQAFLAACAVDVRRFKDNVYALAGTTGPLLCLNSHLDTVPEAPGWTLPPWQATRAEGRVYGLGSNDAKASVAAMTAAFLRLAADGGPAGFRVLLTLAAQEETGGEGSEVLVPELVRQGLVPDAVVVGEPTGLDVAVAQKGLMILELRAKGTACHAAHRQAIGGVNALSELARDLVALEALDPGPAHPDLGPVTIEPTLVSAGTAKNVVPASAVCTLDVRTNPQPAPEEVLARMRSAVAGEIAVIRDRLRPCEIDAGHPLVRAALDVRPGARAFGSRGVSDLVFFRAYPAIKVGPGRTERSHTPDEYVLESEVLDGARFYEALARRWASL